MPLRSIILYPLSLNEASETMRREDGETLLGVDVNSYLGDDNPETGVMFVGENDFISFSINNLPQGFNYTITNVIVSCDLTEANKTTHTLYVKQSDVEDWTVIGEHTTDTIDDLQFNLGNEYQKDEINNLYLKFTSNKEGTIMSEVRVIVEYSIPGGILKVNEGLIKISQGKLTL